MLSLCTSIKEEGTAVEIWRNVAAFIEVRILHNVHIIRLENIRATQISLPFKYGLLNMDNNFIMHIKRRLLFRPGKVLERRINPLCGKK